MKREQRFLSPVTSFRQVNCYVHACDFSLGKNSWSRESFIWDRQKEIYYSRCTWSRWVCTQHDQWNSTGWHRSPGVLLLLSSLSIHTPAVVHSFLISVISSFLSGYLCSSWWVWNWIWKKRTNKVTPLIQALINVIFLPTACVMLPNFLSQGTCHVGQDSWCEASHCPCEQNGWPNCSMVRGEVKLLMSSYLCTCHQLCCCRYEECKTKLTPFLKKVGFNPKSG